MMPDNRGNYPAPSPQPEPNPAQRPYPPSQAAQPYQGQLPTEQPYPNPPQYFYGQPQPAPAPAPTPAPAAKKAKNKLFLWGGLAAGLLCVALAAALVVGPLANRNSRTEADPFAASRNTPAAPVTTGMVPAKETTTTVVSKGDFSRIDAIHYARGTAIVGIGSDGKKFLRFQNFTSAQGPDLRVYLGKNPDGSQLEENGLNLGPLPATDGSYNMALPDDLDLTQYKSVVIWCEAFSVMFSVASLAP